MHRSPPASLFGGGGGGAPGGGAFGFSKPVFPPGSGSDGDGSFLGGFTAGRPVAAGYRLRMRRASPAPPTTRRPFLRTARHTPCGDGSSSTHFAGVQSIGSNPNHIVKPWKSPSQSP